MPDDIERTMQFLLAQQAQSAADLTTWREECGRRHDELRSIVRDIGTALKDTIDLVHSLAEGQAALTGGQVATDRRLDQLSQTVREMGEIGKDSRERLHALMLFVEERERRRADPDNPPH